MLIKSSEICKEKIINVQKNLEKRYEDGDTTWYTE